MSFRVSGKFPETAWRAAHSRQATHVILLHFLSSIRNRLAVNPCTARRHKLEPSFWVVWWTAWRSCTPARRRE